MPKHLPQIPVDRLYVSWSDAADLTSLSESTLRRLVKAGVLSAPVRLGPGRVAFDRELFVRELRAHVARLNAASSPAAPATAEAR